VGFRRNVAIDRGLLTEGDEETIAEVDSFIVSSFARAALRTRRIIGMEKYNFVRTSTGHWTTTCHTFGINRSVLHINRGHLQLGDSRWARRAFDLTQKRVVLRLLNRERKK
jgi:hypothetical protein